MLCPRHRSRESGGQAWQTLENRHEAPIDDQTRCNSNRPQGWVCKEREVTLDGAHAQTTIQNVGAQWSCDERVALGRTNATPKAVGHTVHILNNPRRNLGICRRDIPHSKATPLVDHGDTAGSAGHRSCREPFLIGLGLCENVWHKLGMAVKWVRFEIPYSVGRSRRQAVHTRKPDRQDKAAAKLVAIVALPMTHHTVSSGR